MGGRLSSFLALFLISDCLLGLVYLNTACSLQLKKVVCKY